MARFRMTAVMCSSAEMNRILTQILEENGVKGWEYSLDGYRDERQCLESDGETWQVYFGERGQKRRCKTFPTHKDAATELMRRLGRTEEQRMGLQASMERLWKPMKLVPREKTAELSAQLLDLDAALVLDMKKTEQKVHLAKVARVGIHNELEKNALKGTLVKAVARKMQSKEKKAKTVQKIKTFGFKG